MNKYVRLFFIIILVLAIYHLIRDILQTYGLDSAFTNIGHRPHVWCAPYCDVITWPFDIAAIVMAVIILKRNKSEVLGYALIALLVIFVGLTLLP